MIELASIGPGPFACGMLAEMGADVVRIERRVQGSAGLPGGLDRIGIRDRIIVRADLKDADDLAMVRTMVANADVVVEGFRPGVAERLGVGPAWALGENPSLVYARITGWGQDGPYAGMAGHDINYIGLSGVLDAIGSTDPVPPLNLVGDYGGGGLFVVVGILAALVRRATTGVGGVVDAAMIDGSAKLLEPIRDLANAGIWVERRAANLLDGGAPFYRTYATADGRFMAVGALEPAFYDQFVAGLGIDDTTLPDRMDPTTWDELTKRFASVFATRSRDEWTEVFDGTDACVTPVLAMSEVASHTHNAVRGALVATEDGPRPTAAPRFTWTQPHDTQAGTPTRASISDTLAALGLTGHTVERLEGIDAVHRV